MLLPFLNPAAFHVKGVKPAGGIFLTLEKHEGTVEENEAPRERDQEKASK
jgi:hypothetical protein